MVYLYHQMKGEIQMFKIGDKVVFNETIGYIVKIEIDPIDEFDYDLYHVEEQVTYTIRVFKPFYQYGYYDFRRASDEITLYTED